MVTGVGPESMTGCRSTFSSFRLGVAELTNRVAQRLRDGRGELSRSRAPGGARPRLVRVLQLLLEIPDLPLEALALAGNRAQALDDTARSILEESNVGFHGVSIRSALAAQPDLPLLQCLHEGATVRFRLLLFQGLLPGL